MAVDPRALIFIDATGEPMRHAGVMRRAWLLAVAATGLVGVTPHDLRATHASWVINDGGSVMDAAARLGHAAGKVTTRHYARPVLGRDAEIRGTGEPLGGRRPLDCGEAGGRPGPGRPSGPAVPVKHHPVVTVLFVRSCLMRALMWATVGDNAPRHSAH